MQTNTASLGDLFSNGSSYAAARPFPEKFRLPQSPEWTRDSLSARQHSLARRALRIWRSDL